METVLITGGTGMIGTALTRHLVEAGYKVTVLTRNKSNKKPTPQVSYAAWDVVQQKIDIAAIQSASYIVHLAGANVGKGRWTKKHKAEIVNSRVKSGELLVKALRENANSVKAIIAASATGWYGADSVVPNPNPFVETQAPANDFLGSVVQQWEAAVEPVTALGKRLVILRCGLVLSNGGGAYAEFKKPFRFRTAAVLGSGQQVISFIHINDLVNLYTTAIQNITLSGVFNAVAPHPVNNKKLIDTIAAVKNKTYLHVRVPAFVLKTLLGEMSEEVLKSVTVSAEKIQQRGFHFCYPTIEQAVRQLEG